MAIHTKLRPGELIYGFKLNKIQPFPLYNFTSYELMHEKTKAHYIHLDSKVSDNVFTILLRTPPIDNTGVSYTLGRLLNYGSKKYPVKNVFDSTQALTLSSFTDTWAGFDFSYFSFGSSIEKEMLQLLSVHADSVYFPLLRYEDFMIEGHRFVESKDKRLLRGGESYNRVLRKYHNLPLYFISRLRQNLFQSSPYKYDIIGDLGCISELTHKRVLDYHSSYYHPTNTWFISFGNMDFTKYLQLLEDNVMKYYKEPSSINSQIPNEVLANDNRVRIVQEEGMIDRSLPEDRQMTVAVSKICNVTDDYECFALDLLSKILIGVKNGPFYSVFVDSMLGEGHYSNIDYGTYLKDRTFTLTVGGCLNEQEHIDKAYDTIVDYLVRVKNTRFDIDDTLDILLYNLSLSSVL